MARLSRQLHFFSYSNAEQGFAVPFAQVDQPAGKVLERCGDRYVEGKDARLQNGGDAILPSVVVGKMWHVCSHLDGPYRNPRA